MDITIVFAVGIVCLTILVGVGIVGLIFLKITEKKQEEMTKREQERTEARQAKYRNELIECQMMYGDYPAEHNDTSFNFQDFLPLLGQLLGNKGGVSADTAVSFPGQFAGAEPDTNGSLSEGVRLV